MTCRATYRWLMTLLLATCALIGGPSYAADTTELKAKQIWQLLDYVVGPAKFISRRRRDAPDVQE